VNLRDVVGVGLAVVLSAACGERREPASAQCAVAEPPFGADAAAGERFPDVALTACGGRRITLAEERCQRALTVVSIGAGWCQPCIEETPALQAAHDELADEEMGVVQVLFENAQGAPATTQFCQTWVDSFALSMPVYIDPPGNSIALFDKKVAPFNLLIDRDGRVLWSEVGVIPDDIVGLARSLKP
jgi:cytochrome c biogenesis protein CcmG, thiol:disulfide interchange protein DsbE